MDINVIIIIITGKIDVTASPIFKFVLSATKPKIQGPKQHPVSPHIAKTLNITEEPSGKSFEPKEYIPGHDILTVNPQRAQNISEIIGMLTNATVK